MKTFLLLAFAFTTALGQFAHAKPEDQDEAKQPKKQRQAPAQPRTITQTPKQFQRSATVPPQMPVNRGPRLNPVTPKQMPKVRPYVDQDQVRPTRSIKSTEMTPRIRPNQDVVTTPRTITPVSPNVDPRKRSDWDNRNHTNRNNWQNRVTSHNNSWEEARRRHHRNHHDRSWWRSRYSRFALFGTGYYFWDNGYWFPAYGYDPAYNSYSYDEPIYGYNEMEPAQVIASVQTELQRLGYYRYAVDGEMGPATRAAIADYQRDTGLSITSAIDEPTLQSLGLD